MRQQMVDRLAANVIQRADADFGHDEAAKIFGRRPDQLEIML